MSVIRTKHIEATDHKGARIKASLHTASVTLSYDYALSGLENHKRVAAALADKLNLRGDWNRVWDQSQKEGFTFICLSDMSSGFTV